MGRIIATERISLDGVVEHRGNVWRRWKAGIVRENYARADEPAVAIVFELDSIEDARIYIDDVPLTKAGFLEWYFIPLTVSAPDLAPVHGRD